MKQKDRVSRAALAVMALAIAVTLALEIFQKNKPSVQLPHLEAAIDMNGISTGRRLEFGYQYELLGRCMHAHEAKAVIRQSWRLSAILDSLKNGALDLVIIPRCDSLACDSTLICFQSDSMAMWVFHTRHTDEAKYVSNWISEFSGTPECAEMKHRFFDLYDPACTDSADFISPYDTIFKASADSSGMDWRLLAAIGYVESKFHMESVSSMEASGIMQIMKSTAAAYGCTDRLDPEQNIMTAALLLSKLRDRYSRRIPNKTELQKFMLAAYNAGSGRMDAILDYADSSGISPTWKAVSEVIPNVDGNFNGAETRAFVGNVQSIYNHYCRLFPL